ncbi:DeoR/GlpR family DNA-binding transcription regulator [Robbsia andropogonis]|nr:DeoR/GlpR family DNA-binding transcription regulator [Robbsia andropogonis]
MISCNFMQYQDKTCKIMLTSQRKKLILDMLAKNGQVLAGNLAGTFEVSEDTIRRDLRELASEGLLQRVHGGALPASPAVAPFSARRAMDASGKTAIGRVAASMIAPGQVVVIDGGTTSAELVRHIPHTLSATVVTHSPTVAVALVDHPAIEVIMIGGKLYKHSIVNVGSAAIEAMSHIRADLYFMGVTGVHLTEGLSTGDLEEAYVKRALAARSAETIVLASMEKLNAASAYAIGDVTLAQTIIVESDTSEAFSADLEAAGVSVVRT